VIDTGNPLSKPEELNKNTSSQSDPKPSTSSAKEDIKVAAAAADGTDDFPEKWWFLGVPKYK